jgi:hypothetical protein
MADVVDVHELEPMEGPSGIAVGEHHLHVREAVEDSGRNERQGCVGHRRLQAGRDTARGEGRPGPTHRVVEAHRHPSLVHRIPERIVGGVPRDGLAARPGVENRPAQIQLPHAAEDFFPGVLARGRRDFCQPDESIRAVCAELGDPVVVGPCAGQLEVPVVEEGNRLPEPRRGVQDLGLHAVRILRPEPLRRVVKTREHVGEPEWLPVTVAEVEARVPRARCRRGRQGDGVAPVDYPGVAATQLRELGSTIPQLDGKALEEVGRLQNVCVSGDQSVVVAVRHRSPVLSLPGVYAASPTVAGSS